MHMHLLCTLACIYIHTVYIHTECAMVWLYICNYACLLFDGAKECLARERLRDCCLESVHGTNITPLGGSEARQPMEQEVWYRNDIPQ